MPITANIAPNISTTQTGNFRFAIVFTLSATQILDKTSFTLSNITISDNDDITVRLINVSSNTAFIAVEVDDESSGSFTVDVTGNVTVNRTTETLSGTTKTINYSTVSNIQSTFGIIEYTEDGMITVPVSFGESVKSLSKTDFEMTRISGDDISCLIHWLTGTAASYEMNFIPDVDTVGSFILDIFGVITTVDDMEREEITVTPITVTYDRRIPEAIMEIPEPLSQGRWVTYLEFNKFTNDEVSIVGLSASDFIIDGVENAVITHIYRAVSITSKPTDQQYHTLTDTSIWVAENINTATTAKGRYFVIVFDIPEVTDETINIALKKNSVRNAFHL